MDLWVSITLLVLILGLQWRTLRNIAGAYRHNDERHAARAYREKRYKHWWWPPRMSNVLIIFGAGHYAYDWLWNSPFGSSRQSVRLSIWAMLLGFFCRNWEE